MVLATLPLKVTIMLVECVSSMLFRAFDTLGLGSISTLPMVQLCEDFPEIWFLNSIRFPYSDALSFYYCEIFSVPEDMQYEHSVLGAKTMILFILAFELSVPQLNVEIRVFCLATNLPSVIDK